MSSVSTFPACMSATSCPSDSPWSTGTASMGSVKTTVRPWLLQGAVHGVGEQVDCGRLLVPGHHQAGAPMGRQVAGQRVDPLRLLRGGAPRVAADLDPQPAPRDLGQRTPAHPGAPPADGRPSRPSGWAWPRWRTDGSCAVAGVSARRREANSRAYRTAPGPVVRKSLPSETITSAASTRWIVFTVSPNASRAPARTASRETGSN